MAKPSWMHSRMCIIHFVEVLAPRMAKECATTCLKALVGAQGEVSFPDSIQGVQLLPSWGAILRDGVPSPLITHTPWHGVRNASLEWGSAKLWGRRMVGKVLSFSLLLVLFRGRGALPRAPSRRGARVHGCDVIGAMPLSPNTPYDNIQEV
jgi:hypothetical protein